MNDLTTGTLIDSVCTCQGVAFSGSFAQGTYFHTIHNRVDTGHVLVPYFCSGIVSVCTGWSK